MTIQMWIAPISYSNRSAAVIAEAIEVDSKPFESFLPFEVSVTCACMNKLHCIPCLLFMLKIVRVINFRGSITHENFLTTKYFQATVYIYIYTHRIAGKFGEWTHFEHLVKESLAN